MLIQNTGANTMALHKTAIAVPATLLADVDRAAAERGESRSAYITRVLAAAVRARRDAEITKKLDELFADVRVKKEQRRAAAALDEVGTDWTDERW
jgi:metal-responsive CopG/Arc/MetJ family transcriptional regulator